MKRENQREKILALLKAAGPSGVTNVTLNQICFRFGARIWELRKEWDVDTIKVGNSGVFRFVLKGRREPEQLRLIA